MRVLPNFVARFLYFAGFLCYAAACSAQTIPYAGAGIGANGLSFQSPYYNVDAGVDWGGLKTVFYEAEAGADTANPKTLNNGTTFRGHGQVMIKGKSDWRYGGGFHFSELVTSKYHVHSIWPTVGAMYEHDWFRLNAQFLIPTGTDYSLTGPLFDMRMHLHKHFYFRERVGIYAYRNPNEPHPGHHISAVADFGLLYTFR